jgi:hypothetical protein
MDKLLASLSFEDQELLRSLAMQSLLSNGTVWLKMNWNDTEQKLQWQKIDTTDTLALPVNSSTSKKQDEC